MERDSLAINHQQTLYPPRRRFLKASIAGMGAGLLASNTRAQEPKTISIARKAFSSDHQLKPLRFNTSKLAGLSQRLIESHWSNNYGGSVRALNGINKRLNAALDDKNLQAFVYNDLKREHLMRTGSVTLHELYFDNLGGDGKAPANIRTLLASTFGNFDLWESEYRRIAAGLGGGSGWVMLGYNQHFQTLENYWLADHMHSPTSTVPLLVMDMYEHSYHMDYGAATARYIDAFFKNINWDQVVARVDAVESMSS